MNVADYFEAVGDYAVVRPTVECTLDEAKDLITAAIAMAQEKKIARLMVDTRGMTGFKPPSIVDRYFFVRDWANAGRGQVRVVIVARPEMIDEQRFGVVAARNVGLISNVFESEKEALEWLSRDGF